MKEIYKKNKTNKIERSEINEFFLNFFFMDAI